MSSRYFFNKRIPWYAIILGLVFSVRVDAGGLLRFTTADDAGFVGNYPELISKAYALMGYQIEIVKLPAKRALYQAKSDSSIDGELLRVKSGEKWLPNHIRIPVPIVKIEVAAYVKGIQFEVSGWPSLSPYKLGAVRGFIAIEKQISGYDTTFVTETSQVMEMLELGRIQIGVVPRIIGDEMLKRGKYKGIRSLDKNIYATALFHFIHSKHKDLVPDLTSAIKQVLARDAGN
mgnify:CR=1 FL=1